MRTVQIKVYHYDELPSEEAQARARQWWIDCEIQNPAWYNEHFESMEACVRAIDYDLSLEEIKKQSHDLKFTGYAMDYLLCRFIEDFDRLPTAEEMKQDFFDEWTKEMNDRLENVEYIEDAIRTNEYEFTENGEVF